MFWNLFKRAISALKPGKESEQVSEQESGQSEVWSQDNADTSSGFVAGTGETFKSASTVTGGTGSTSYTVGDIVKALKAYGLLTA